MTRWTEQDYANHLNKGNAEKSVIALDQAREGEASQCVASFFTVLGPPVAKPRQTRRDRWLDPPRPCVARYRLWADKARRGGPLPFPVGTLHVVAYLPIPDGYSAKKREAVKGTPHRLKPDCDNILKAVSDALIENDQIVYEARIAKRWDDGDGPRVEIAIYP